MNRGRFDRWIRAYLAAWRTDDPRAIGSLFAPRAVYATGPFDKLWRGRKAIVAAWVARGDSQLEWRFRHRVVAVEGSFAVIQGTTTYAASGNRRARTEISGSSG